jgi:hypothetical protein
MKPPFNCVFFKIISKITLSIKQSNPVNLHIYFGVFSENKLASAY